MVPMRLLVPRCYLTVTTTKNTASKRGQPLTVLELVRREHATATRKQRRSKKPFYSTALLNVTMLVSVSVKLVSTSMVGSAWIWSAGEMRQNGWLF
jgi:hypothetical protein